MQAAKPPVRRKQVPSGPVTPQELSSSNQTSSHFLGTTQRAWMLNSNSAPSTTPLKRLPSGSSAKALKHSPAVSAPSIHASFKSSGKFDHLAPLSRPSTTPKVSVNIRRIPPRTGEETAKETRRGPVQDNSQLTTKETGKDSRREIQKEIVKEPGRAPLQDNAISTTDQTSRDLLQDNARSTTNEIQRETAKESAQRAESQIAEQTGKQTAPQTTMGVVREKRGESAHGSAQSTARERQSEPAKDITAESADELAQGSAQQAAKQNTKDITISSAVEVSRQNREADATDITKVIANESAQRTTNQPSLDSTAHTAAESTRRAILQEPPAGMPAENNETIENPERSPCVTDSKPVTTSTDILHCDLQTKPSHFPGLQTAENLSNRSTLANARSSTIPTSAAVKQLQTYFIPQSARAAGSAGGAWTIHPSAQLKHTVSAPETTQKSGPTRHPSSATEEGYRATQQLMTPIASPIETQTERKRSLPQMSVDLPLPPAKRPRLPDQRTSTVPPLPVTGPTVPSTRLQIPNSLVLHSNASHAQQETTAQPGQRGHHPKAESYLLGLTTTLAEMSTRINFDKRSEFRILWVRDACVQGDLFFLLLHQLACMSTVQRPMLEAQLGINDAYAPGISVLESLFERNDALPPELLAYFAGFPNSPYMLDVSQELRPWVVRIRHFLLGLKGRWETMKANCYRRGYPPSPLEIEEGLQCPRSVVLPRAFFGSIDRLLHGFRHPIQGRVSANYDATWADKACQFFQQNQQRMFMQFPTLQVPDLNPVIRRQELQLFAVAYRRLLIEHDHQQRPVVQSNNTVLRDSNRRMSHTQANATQSAQPGGPLVVNQTNGQMHAHGPVQGESSTRREGQTPLAAVQRAVPVQSQGDPSTPNHVNGSVEREFTREREQQSTAIPQQRSVVVPHRGGRPVANHIHVPIQRQFNAVSGPNGRDRLPLQLPNQDPAQTALHQAYLATPILCPSTAAVTGSSDFYFISSFALTPSLVSAQQPFGNVSFSLSPAHLEKIATYTSVNSQSSGRLLKRNVSDRTILLNLRCVAFAEGTCVSDMSQWSSLATSYPQHCFISMNEHHLQLRRKRHFKKDLPVDVTPFVRQSNNTVVVSVHPTQQEADKRFAIAVEIVEVSSHERALTMPEKIEPMDSLAKIIKALKPDHQDEDVMIDNSNVSIDLKDPFTSELVRIPVRGKSCTHRECFDLETFLQSRACSTKDPLTEIYQWLCPLCKKDARPPSLVLDGFLHEVTKHLRSIGKTDNVAIRVREDGNWEAIPPKIHPHDTKSNGEDTQSITHGEDEKVPRDPHPVEVIELD